MNPNTRSAILKLEDGTIFTGFSFGADVSAEGEVVFNTAMAGYPELLADPLMKGHIVVMTWPLVGNYGVPAVEELETDRVQAAGLVVTDYSEEYSHWNATKSLGEWLREWGLPAICGIDTRELAKHLRERGEMTGRIIIDLAPSTSSGAGSGTGQAAEPLDKFETTPAEALSSRSEARGEGSLSDDGDVTIRALGEGLRRSIIASLNRRGARVTTDFSQPCDGYLVTGTVAEAPDGLISDVKKALASGKPVLGVCGGDLPIALAAGARIERLAHPHRGTNQPVIERGTSHAFITTQNHAWAVAADSLPGDWEVWMENLNDGSVEGIRRRDGFARAVQFHPEATLRPEEKDELYDQFIEAIR